MSMGSIDREEAVYSPCSSILGFMNAFDDALGIALEVQRPLIEIASRDRDKVAHGGARS